MEICQRRTAQRDQDIFRRLRWTPTPALPRILPQSRGPPSSPSTTDRQLINNTGAGNQWAQARGLDVPVMPPPTEYCNPNDPRPYVVFSTPSENATLEGVVQLRGAITMPEFNRFEVRYGVSHDPGAFSQPFIVDTNQRPEGESILGEWDTRTVANGPYTLRLVAIDNFGRSVSRDVHVTVNNPEPTALPTLTLAPTPTSAPPAEQSAPSEAEQAEAFVLPSPTQAPTLTPTWTLTPTPQ